MRGMGRYNGDSFFGTVANTSHCKSPADPESRRGSPCVRTSQSVQEASQKAPRGAPQTAHRLPSPSLLPKNSQPLTSSLKIKKSGELTAPLQLFNSGSVDVTTDAAAASSKVNLTKTLSIYGGNRKGEINS